MASLMAVLILNFIQPNNSRKLFLYWCLFILSKHPLSQSITAAVLDRAEKSIDRNAEVEILRFAA
jgi:hypothetical protein